MLDARRAVPELPDDPVCNGERVLRPIHDGGQSGRGSSGDAVLDHPSVTIVSGGSEPGSGTATFDNGRQTLDITGGGDCGYTQIAGALKLRVN